MKNVLNEWEVNKWSDDRSMEVKLPTLLGYYDGPTPPTTDRRGYRKVSLPNIRMTN